MNGTGDITQTDGIEYFFHILSQTDIDQQYFQETPLPFLIFASKACDGFPP
jgi:hypothetical protein